MLKKTLLALGALTCGIAGYVAPTLSPTTPFVFPPVLLTIAIVMALTFTDKYFNILLGDTSITREGGPIKNSTKLVLKYIVAPLFLFTVGGICEFIYSEIIV